MWTRTKWSGAPPRSQSVVARTSPKGRAETSPETASSSKSGFEPMSGTSSTSRYAHAAATAPRAELGEGARRPARPARWGAMMGGAIGQPTATRRHPLRRLHSAGLLTALLLSLATARADGAGGEAPDARQYPARSKAGKEARR